MSALVSGAADLVDVGVLRRLERTRLGRRSMLIRRGTPADVQHLARLGERLHRESDYSQYPFSLEKVEGYLRALVESPEGIVLVAEEGGEIVGTFVGSVGTHWFGDCGVSYDLALFVVPERRGSMLGVRLVREYVKIATAMGVEEILIGNSTAVRADRVEMVERLYERLGFRRRSGNYRFGGLWGVEGKPRRLKWCPRGLRS